jgi:hypothetical protein
MEKFEFKSAVCTSVEQSKRLLKLGLKKETADCGHCSYGGTYIVPKWPNVHNWDNDIPAWSLQSLLFLIPKEVNIDGFKFPLRSDAIMRLEDADCMYERLIGIIERVIEQGYFNKDYLEDKK